jgi:hypothetical protein
MSSNYYKLGMLPPNIVENFKKEILKNKIFNKNYYWIQFNECLEEMFLSLFKSLPLKIQFNPETNRRVQKIFYSNPGYGYRIHKDGIKCKSALNIAISANESDWVRWYSDDVIYNLENNDIKVSNVWGYSRDTNLKEYEDIPYIDELKTISGMVYILDVDKFHSFKCNGPEPRIIIQTKFENFPSLLELKEKINFSLFKNIERI